MTDAIVQTVDTTNKINNLINNNMKRLIIIILALFAGITISAQTNSNVLKFMGIPVDGNKTQVIQKLKEKGFEYNSVHDCLTGRFNGKESRIFISTNKNKVDRIMVCDANVTDETNIRIAYNTLLQQFNNNSKYITIEDNKPIPEDERISYGISLHNKRYEAVFYLKENITQGCVWFMISEAYGDYYIAIFYDNLNNRPNGEDL